ncbi:MAG: hypothetical protein QM679_07095, partial [Patulibacter sp.]
AAPTPSRRRALAAADRAVRRSAARLRLLVAVPTIGRIRVIAPPASQSAGAGATASGAQASATEQRGGTTAGTTTGGGATPGDGSTGDAGTPSTSDATSGAADAASDDTDTAEEEPVVVGPAL